MLLRRVRTFDRTVQGSLWRRGLVILFIADVLQSF